MTGVVYRAYATDGALLYVGCTSQSPIARIAQHTDKPWFADIVRVELEHFDSRDHALAEESRAILEEAPKYNVARRKALSEDELRRRREAREANRIEREARVAALEAESYRAYGITCGNCGNRPHRLPKGWPLTDVPCPTCEVSALRQVDAA